MPLPAGLDREALVFLERHETRCHTTSGREMRDLGDALLLHDPRDREPFWNRLAALRWPADARAFDRRLAEALALFAGIDRMPHVWPRPAYNEPVDLVDRLLAAGWEDVGGGKLMVLDGPDMLDGAARTGKGVSVDHFHRLAGDTARRITADVALVLVESFEIEPSRQAALEGDTLASWERDEMHAYLVRVDGEPAAVARRTTFDGASYLSSIGVRPAFRGRGLGRVATALASSDSVAAGCRWTYLGVFSENRPAIALYERLGFVAVGAPAPDLVLR